jgi:uncharacterized protein YjlB
MLLLTAGNPPFDPDALPVRRLSEAERARQAANVDELCRSMRFVGDYQAHVAHYESEVHNATVGLLETRRAHELGRADGLELRRAEIRQRLKVRALASAREALRLQLRDHAALVDRIRNRRPANA